MNDKENKEKTYLMEWSTLAHGKYKVKAKNLSEAYDKLFDDMEKLNNSEELNPDLVVTFLDPDELDNDLEVSPVKIVTDDGKEIDIRDIEEEMI